ncbi:hypothetical protein HWV62_9017 [Athelia sp. TMB]|nr:hypothetical protein HWV62_9017 [Athelia sp. TMB]
MESLFTEYRIMKSLRSISIAINVFAAAGDVFIAATLCALFHRARSSNEGYTAPSNNALKTLVPIAIGFVLPRLINVHQMLFTMNTGLLTSLCSAACLISAIVEADVSMVNLPRVSTKFS